jgi:hypothetical protein
MLQYEMWMLNMVRDMSVSLLTSAATHIWFSTYTYIYRVSQEECAKLWESVPYVNVYRYNPKHLYPKLNGYGDNSQRNVGASCGSKYCNPHSWPSRDTAHVLETDSRIEQCACVYQNAQSAKFYQFFHTATGSRKVVNALITKDDPWRWS